MMSQTLLLVGFFVVLFAMLPWAIKRIQSRASKVGAGAVGACRVVSAVGVGPHQRVVTVEVGPPGAQTMLVLGVTNQTITCLHTMAVNTPVANTPVDFRTVLANGSVSSNAAVPADGAPRV
ncbi:FliO/MopB family protein [Variovorax sp. HJSM1_2]|uniref:FliO/MopB family protein n=1 Tax=Variovorax sp. HJSM1_2 TaxID=3366263 RepID=UPI003BE7F89F